MRTSAGKKTVTRTGQEGEEAASAQKHEERNVCDTESAPSHEFVQQRTLGSSATSSTRKVVKYIAMIGGLACEGAISCLVRGGVSVPLICGAFDARSVEATSRARCRSIRPKPLMTSRRLSTKPLCCCVLFGRCLDWNGKAARHADEAASVCLKSASSKQLWTKWGSCVRWCALHECQKSNPSPMSRSEGGKHAQARRARAPRTWHQYN